MKLVDDLTRERLLSPATVQGAVLYAIVFALAAWLLGWALRASVERALARDKHDHLDRMAVKFLAKLLRYCVYVFALVAYTHFVPSLSSLGTASLTSISVITVIVGLAAQNTLGNLVAGISLLLYRPFKLGDRLQVVAPTVVETGTVENLTLGYTLLTTDDHRRVVVPNSLMASQTTINLTGNDPRLICTVPDHDQLQGGYRQGPRHHTGRGGQASEGPENFRMPADLAGACRYGAHRRRLVCRRTHRYYAPLRFAGRNHEALCRRGN